MTLQKEFEKMLKDDQNMHGQFKIRHDMTQKEKREDAAVMKRHIKRLKEVISQYGWPNARLVGKKGADAAWLIAQHADNDIVFQKRCLQLLKEEKWTPAIKIHIAYLTDRVLANQKKHQIYGTQFRGTKYPDRIPPIIGINNVDKRREKMGLKPYSEYLAHMEKKYGGRKFSLKK